MTARLEGVLFVVGWYLAAATYRRSLPASAVMLEADYDAAREGYVLANLYDVAEMIP